MSHEIAAPARRRSDGVLRVVFGDDAHRDDPAVATRRRLAVSAVLAVALASMVLSTLNLLATPPFTPPDELPHVGYALSLAYGEELPRATDVIDHTRMPHMRPGITQAAATHPPLANLLMGIPLRIGNAVDAPVAGLFAARSLMVLAAGTGYVLLGWLALVLLPSRPSVALTATAVAALIPNHVHIAGQMYTDAAGFAAITGLLLAGVLVLTRGPSTGRLVALLLFAAIAANFRVVGAVAAVGVAGAAGVGAWLHTDERRGGRRALRGVLTAGAVVGSAVMTSAWFYVLNQRRYGSPTGAGQLMALHEREERAGTTLDWLFEYPQVWGHIHDQSWNRVESWALEGGYLPDVVLTVGQAAVFASLLAALLAGVYRLVAGGWRRPLGTVTAWAMLVVWLGVVVYGIADFVQGGGGPHARYLWPAIGIVVLWVAFGLAALPGARRGLPGVAFVGLVAFAAVNNTVAFTFRRTVEGAPAALRLLALEQPEAAAGVLAASGVVVLVLLGWWMQAVVRIAPHDARPPVGSGDPEVAGVPAVVWRGTAVRGVHVDVVGAVLAWTAATVVGLLWHRLLGPAWPAALIPAVAALVVVIAVVVAHRRTDGSQKPTEQVTEEVVSA